MSENGKFQNILGFSSSWVRIYEVCMCVGWVLSVLCMWGSMNVVYVIVDYFFLLPLF